MKLADGYNKNLEVDVSLTHVDCVDVVPFMTSARMWKEWKKVTGRIKKGFGSYEKEIFRNL